MICNVIFCVGSDLSLFSLVFQKDKSREDFLKFALYKLIDMYTAQFVYMLRSIDSIDKNIDDLTVSIIGYFDDKYEYFSSCENYKFKFSDLDVFKDLKSKLDEKFHIGSLKKSNVKYAKKGDFVVNLDTDDDVKEYVKEMKSNERSE